MSSEIDIVYDGKLRCSATHLPSGATIRTDAPEAFSPTDLVAAAYGTCILTIMGILAERSGIDLAGTRVRIVKEMVSSPARRIGEFKVRITYPKGLKLADADRAKLEKAINTCPVRQSLHPEIRHTVIFA